MFVFNVAINPGAVMQQKLYWEVDSFGELKKTASLKAGGGPAWLGLSLQQLQLPGAPHGLGAIANVQLLKDVGCMALDRSDSDE